MSKKKFVGVNNLPFGFGVIKPNGKIIVQEDGVCYELTKIGNTSNKEDELTAFAHKVAGVDVFINNKTGDIYVSNKGVIYEN